MRMADPPMPPLTDQQELGTNWMEKHSAEFRRVFDPSSSLQAQESEPPAKKSSKYVEENPPSPRKTDELVR